MTTASRAAKPLVRMTTPIAIILVAFISLFNVLDVAEATPSPVVPRQAPEAQPTFPPSPPSCPICAQNFGSIDSCAQAAPVLANFTEVLFNPGAFLSVITCACSDTFQSAYPQCVDCFIQTNQTQFLNISSDLPDPSSTGSSILTGIRNICSFGSTILGNVSGADNETLPTTSAAPVPSTSSAALRLTPGPMSTFGSTAVGVIGSGGMTYFWAVWTVIFGILLF